MELFTPTLISSIVDLAMLIIIAFVGWLVRRIYAGLPSDKQAAIRGIADMVVPAVEQQFKDLGNKEKRVQAINTAKFLLSTIGLKNIPDSMIETAIEAAVRAMKQQQTTVNAPKH